jgi:hypothetical protein
MLAGTVADLQGCAIRLSPPEIVVSPRQGVPSSEFKASATRVLFETVACSD